MDARIWLVLLLLLTSASAIAQTQKRAKQPLNVTGHYRLKEAEKRNSFEAQKLAGNQIRFHILALWVSPYNPDNIHNGEVSGTVRLTGDTAVYSDETCKLKFKFTASSVVIEQDETAGDCEFGANVNASGSYRKLDNKRPIFEN